MSEAGILIQFTSPYDHFAVVVDDDGEACYAYLKRDGKIVAHVWLYNRGEAPVENAWESSGEEPPFKNSKGYVKEMDFPVPVEDSEFSVEWIGGDRDGEVFAVINLRGLRLAEFLYGKRVGRSYLSAKENKIAWPL